MRDTKVYPYNVEEYEFLKTFHPPLRRRTMRKLGRGFKKFCDNVGELCDRFSMRV